MKRISKIKHDKHSPAVLGYGDDHFTSDTLEEDFKVDILSKAYEQLPLTKLEDILNPHLKR